MSPETTSVPNATELVGQFVEAFWNHGDTAALALLADDYVDHAYQPPNREGLLHIREQIKSSFPDAVQTIHAQVAQGDLVVLRMRMNATHSGAFRGTPATGNPIDVAVYRMFRVENGRIAEHWALLDTATLLRQIGSAPTP